MSSPATLLPPSSTLLERATALACADAVDLPMPHRDLWNPDACPLALLPYLAWAWSVDEWDATWPEARQRQAVRDSLELHRRKGTVWAVKRTITNHGWRLHSLIEGGSPVLPLDGGSLGGEYSLGAASGWAVYRVVLNTRRVSAAQKETLRRALLAVAPRRCLLAGINYLPLPLSLDGGALSGEYNLGATYG